MSKGLLGTGVTAWVESDTAVRHAAPLKDGSGYGQIVIGEGTGVVCLFLDDPAACYKLAGVAVTLARALEARAKAAAGATHTPSTTGKKVAARVQAGLDLLTPSGEVSA